MEASGTDEDDADLDHDPSVRAPRILRAALDGLVCDDLVPLVSSFLTGPLLLVLGGDSKADIAAYRTAEVWSQGRWTNARYVSEGQVHDMVGDDWRWHARTSALPAGLSAMCVLSDVRNRESVVGAWLAVRTYQLASCSDDKGSRWLQLQARTERLSSSPVATLEDTNDVMMAGIYDLLDVDDGRTYAITRYTVPSVVDASGRRTSVLVLDHDGTWRLLTHGVPPVRIHSAVWSHSVCVGNDIYVLDSGCTGYRFSASQGSWWALPQSRVKRSYHRPAYDRVRQHLYLVGSTQAIDRRLKPAPPADETHSCERLSIADQRWADMPMMLESRWGAALIVYGDRLIAIGGRTIETDTTRDDAEYLCLSDSKTKCKQWVRMASMRMSREDALVLACDTFS